MVLNPILLCISCSFINHSPCKSQSLKSGTSWKLRSRKLQFYSKIKLKVNKTVPDVENASNVKKKHLEKYYEYYSPIN